MIANERDTHHFGDGLTGDVILGGPQPATKDNGIAAPQGQPNAADNALKIVAHLGLMQRVDSSQRQFLTEPGRVGVHDLAEQKFRANGNDFTAHNTSFLTKGCMGVAAVSQLH